LAHLVRQHRNVQRQISQRQLACHVLGPLGEFQARAGKDVTKTRLSPFTRIAEAVKIKMPDVKGARALGQFIGLDHRVGRAFDAPLHTQRTQQMPHEGGFARAKLTVQLDEGIADVRARRERLCQGLRRRFITPDSFPRGFYNGCATMQQILQTTPQIHKAQLLSQMRAWALELGFSQIGVTGVDLSAAEAPMLSWLAKGFHGDMAYMAAHGLKRARPAELVPGTVSVLTARLDYLPAATSAEWQSIEFDRLRRPQEAIVSLYARGRDYHKVLRSRLQKLCERIQGEVGPFGHRVFTDSAPVLEAELAVRSGHGWRGKHTLVLNREAGSMFFLGEIYLDFALPHSEPVSDHCGTCSACIDICPTQAILSPGLLDARRCISYLTIEHPGVIPVELRPLIGNRIYGCDDCQLVCPWNKFAQRSALPDFDEREGLTAQQLVTLFNWREDEFLRHTEGSPIRRIGYERWLRNVAVGMGNALRVGENAAIAEALQQRAQDPSCLVREHVAWALSQVALVDQATK
jgi:epoxyqueuosine reductase